ncbi:MAG: chromosome segregation protein SMC [Erysipelotrichia bacterium]|nr:chromosome segregation protein SMC [Erysipelotrichia bacterium]
MFLKRIILLGFKSFAQRTVIDFDCAYTGIVGPNGCGKSNIIDAIKWVLGEQSAKNMRGNNMSDVVFAGSQDKKGVNMAEVTLVFDNSGHILNSDYSELEITRRLYKSNNESEYLINKTPCRLRDVIDLTLDSGLGKDSLSIITQGNIQAFAEAKPLERRALFEEAASVSKYKKRKNESLNKLIKTQENIDRLKDVLTEMERQVTPLKKQAIKAEQYINKKERLTEIEVAVIVNDIKTQNDDLKTIEQQLFDLGYKETTSKASIQIMENTTNQLREEINKIDNEVHQLQDKLMKSLNEIQLLEKRKAEVEEKRKYILETGTTAAKIEETYKAMNDAQIEYTNRLEKKQILDTEIDLCTKNIEIYNNKVIDISKNINQYQNNFNYLNNRKSVLENLLKSPFEKENGVKTIIDNKSILPGIFDVISNLLKPDDGYQQMLTTALANSIYHIVTKDEESAKNAIKFLKKNKAGSATFLPMNILKARYPNKEHLFIAENSPGFLGLASDFVDCDEKYDVVVLSLLGNVLVCDDLDSATLLARRLNQQYKIVTLDGDVIYRGGTMSGGYNKKINSPLTYQNQLSEIENKISEITDQIKIENTDLNKYQKLLNDCQQDQIAKKIQLASVKEVLDIKREKWEKLKEEYDRIKPDNMVNNTDYHDELMDNLNNAYNNKDELCNEINRKRERRVAANSEMQRKYAQLRQVRTELNETESLISSLNIEKTKAESSRDNLLERLGRDYQMTYEFAASKQYDIDIEAAKEEVLVLRREIRELGNVNLDAPKDYAEINQRYEFMDKQIKELTASKDNLLSIISEMDETMSKQFKETFDKINDSLNEVFTVLFGGGKAKLILEDPNDILNTGIDIDVQPPGKSIQNIRLFSGGEKSLIAICVLFAILKARPVPLCIFDEVEASLDQGNVDRFARYIHKFSQQAQFIVITHRPGTMAECDVLYGITMQHKGVSNVIKVKLKDALDYVKEEKDGTVQ